MLFIILAENLVSLAQLGSYLNIPSLYFPGSACFSLYIIVRY